MHVITHLTSGDVCNIYSVIQSAKTPPLSYNLQQALIQIFLHPINNRWIELSPALHT